MVYLSADNTLEEAALLDLGEMEAAGRSERVNVVVQLDRAVGETAAGDDWTDTRRYLVGEAEPVVVPGELNMGDPGTLADFLSWAVSTYPANRYALILKGPGAGWQGVAFDRDTPGFEGGDNLSLADLDGALAQVLDGRRLDVIAFDASLMAQLDVLRIVQPYASYAVAAAGPVPAAGWDYQSLFRRIYASPELDGEQLAQQMVAEFASQRTPAGFTSMAAVDLARLPALAYSVEVLAMNLAANPAFVAGAVAEAYSDAVAYRVATGLANLERQAAIDLAQFAAGLADRSPDERAATAAEDVIETAAAAVVAGAELPDMPGLTLYFPRYSVYYDASYSLVAGAAAWNAFLKSYHGTNVAGQPQVMLASALDRPAGLQSPALLDLEIVGRQIENVAFRSGRTEEDGRQRLLLYETMVPGADTGAAAGWRDGVHYDFTLWHTEGTYLYDAEGNGDFVVAWPVGAETDHFAVAGRYRQAAADLYLDAYAIFERATAQLVQLWGNEGGALVEVWPHAGDEFQPYAFYRQATGEPVPEPGVALFFDEEQPIVAERRPLPDGNYFFGVVAANASGATAEAAVDVAVANSAVIPGYRAYLDPDMGFQFLYPDTWSAPVYDGSLLYAGDGQTQMQLTAYPNMEPGAQLAQLKAEALATFGAVDILFEDEVVVGGIRGLRTAYGYTNAGGEVRTGVFFVVIQDRLGFVVDVDGTAEDEANTVAAAAIMAEQWRFAPAGFSRQKGQWTRFDFGAFSVAQPPGFAYQAFNEWQRFSSGRHTFVALRVQPATGSAPATLAALLGDAGDGVAGFNPGDLYAFPLAGVVWQRADFSYQTAEGDDVWGFIMAREEDGQEIVAWAEAPAATYNELERDVFLTVIADLALAD